MYGKNPRARRDYRDDGSLLIKELFYTLQGEGPLAGRPAVFIRLGGCNLKCRWCDTDFDGGERVGALELVTRCEALAGPLQHKLVVITGGEPLLQNLRPLTLALTMRGAHVQLETAGSVSPVEDEWLPATFQDVVCSPKTGKVHPRLITLYQQVMSWKYILRTADTLSPADGLPLTSPQTGLPQRLARPPAGTLKHRIYVQPCDEKDEAKNRANRELARDIALQYGYRLSLQVHKIVGVE